MKKYLWFIYKYVRDYTRWIVKRIRSLYVPITVDSLKRMSAQELPSPVHWRNIADGKSIIVEIGSGHGEVLLANNRESSISVGYETKTRFFKLTRKKLRKRADSFVYQGNGYEGSLQHFSRGSISIIFILFPDPWHKKKHAKRRPIKESYFREIAQNLKNEGALVIATDWGEYAQFIWKEAQKVVDLYEISKDTYTPSHWSLPVTHFHQKWVRKGRNFTQIVLKKRG